MEMPSCKWVGRAGWRGRVSSCDPATRGLWAVRKVSYGADKCRHPLAASRFSTARIPSVVGPVISEAAALPDAVGTNWPVGLLAAHEPTGAPGMACPPER